MSEKTQPKEPRLTGKQRRFADRYLANGLNATEAYMFAYEYPESKYDQASVMGSSSLRNPKILTYIEHHMRAQAMGRDEWLKRQAAIATFDPSRYIKRDSMKRDYLDVAMLKREGFGWMIESISYSTSGISQVKLMSRETAMQNIGRALGVYNRIEISGRDGEPLIKVISRDDYDAV